MDGGRRPARARKAVTHYSDDNPSTFTVKRKKGDAAESPSPPPPSRLNAGIPRELETIVENQPDSIPALMLLAEFTRGGRRDAA